MTAVSLKETFIWIGERDNTHRSGGVDNSELAKQFTDWEISCIQRRADS